MEALVGSGSKLIGMSDFLDEFSSLANGLFVFLMVFFSGCFTGE